MKQPRVKIAVALLTGIVGVVAWSGYCIWNESKIMQNKSVRLEVLVAQEAPDEVVNAAMDELFADWKRTRLLLMLYLPASEVEPIDNSVAKLLPMYQAECDELTAELSALTATFERIRREEFMVL